jgi:hypothetical protein
MTLTIIKAAFANEDDSAAVLETAESGAVAISQQDRPELWQLMIAWRDQGGVIEPFTQPEEPESPPAGPLSPEAKLAAFLRHSPDVWAFLQAKGLVPADLRSD